MTTTSTTTTKTASANNSADTGSTIFAHEHTLNVMCGCGGAKQQRGLFSMSLSSSASSSSAASSHSTSSSCVCVQQQHTSSSSVSHSPARTLHPAEMTNNNYKHNTNISDSVSSTDTNTSGVFTLSAWLPFLQSVTRFLVSLVYGPSPSPAADHHIDAADDRTDSVDETFDDDQCSLIDSLIDASLLFPRPSSLRRRGITRNRTPPEQPESFLHTSLLELIAMEAPQCMAAPAQLAHGIGAAVDLYLGGQPEQTIARSPGRTSGRFTQKRMDKRKHVLHKQEHGSGGGHIVWPKCRSPTSPPATTMHTLATTLNVKPVHKHANKNRREKERHVLTRYINDDLYDADLRQHDSTAGVDDVDVDVAFDTVDFCIVRSPASVSAIACAASTLNICLNVPESKLQQQSFACFTHEDFPEMRPKATAAHAATAATANTTTALIVDSDAPIAAVVSITVTAVAPASYTPSLSWEISADELRTPSKRPGGMRKIAAAAVCIVDSYAPIAATSAITTQYQQLLLAGLRPHRERQISECSDDFICFERDDDVGSEGSICYDIADDSSDSDEMEDDDDEDDDDSEDGSDDDSDDDEVDNGHSKTAHVESDDDSESDSESETNSATHQLDSGFEENKVNKVRFAAVPQVHLMHTWHYAYRQARKGKWEQIGRDRGRFADRVRSMHDTLSAVLSAEHRERVLRRRDEQAGCKSEHLM